MEINRFEDAVGATAQEDLVEGLFVVIVPDATGQSMSGLNGTVGARRPATAAEAVRARWVVTWPQSQMPMPGPLAYPSLAYSLRKGGFDQAQSVDPMNLNIYLVYPGMQESRTIPSGYDCVLQGGGEGTYTVPSGLFVPNAGLVPGAMVEVLNVADDTTSAGKLSLTSTESLAVADVVFYDATKQKLTVRTRGL